MWGTENQKESVFDVDKKDATLKTMAIRELKLSVYIIFPVLIAFQSYQTCLIYEIITFCRIIHNKKSMFASLSGFNQWYAFWDTKCRCITYEVLLPKLLNLNLIIFLLLLQFTRGKRKQVKECHKTANNSRTLTIFSTDNSVEKVN